jgi:hypothetical protein
VADDPFDDPFDDVVFDEAFVAGARRTEEPAEVRAARAAQARRSHEDLRRRLAADAAAAQQAERRARRRRRLTGRGAGATLAVLLLLGALVWARATPDRVIVLAEPRLEPVRVEDGPTLRPADSSVPLGTPPAAPAGGTARFLLLDDGGEPVTYDPCRPIELVVDERTMPRGAEDLVAEAVAEVTELTGLSLVLEGVTDERPTLSRDPYQPDRYGERWAPVLVTWSDPGELDLLDGSVIGFAGSLHLEVPGQPPTYVSGMVALDGPDLELMIDDGRPDLARAVILHELAHLLGLDHVDDPDELMFPEQQDDSVAFGRGDRRGLAALGAGPCVPLR